MTSQSRKHRGYASQRIVANFFATHGWPYAESTGAGRSGTDITGMPGIDVEVKARRGLVIAETMKQLRERQEENLLPIAVLRLDGQGPESIQDWPVLIPLRALTALLRQAGYGSPS